MPIKIAVGLPVYRNVIIAEQALTWLDFGVVAGQHTDVFDIPVFLTANLCGVERARNNLTQKSMDAGVDWLLMLDSDNFIDRNSAPNLPGSEAMLRMIKTAHEATNIIKKPTDVVLGSTPVAMIAAPVRGRSVDTEKNKVNVQRRVGLDWYQVPMEALQNKVTEVEFIGTGCCAINIQWLQSKWPEYPWWVSEYPPGGKQLGEDFFFCREARARGARILCDGRFIPGHKSIGG